MSIQCSCIGEGTTEVASKEDIAETAAMLVEIYNCNNLRTASLTQTPHDCFDDGRGIVIHENNIRRLLGHLKRNKKTETPLPPCCGGVGIVVVIVILVLRCGGCGGCGGPGGGCCCHGGCRVYLTY